MDCIFCKIINGNIPSKKVYEDDFVYAFHDISPEAPTHILVIPKKHITSIMDVSSDDMQYIIQIHMAIQKLAQKFNVADSGFRIVNNCGDDGGQTVNHLHYHLLGGRNLGWPPG